MMMNNMRGLKISLYITHSKQQKVTVESKPKLYFLLSMEMHYRRHFAWICASTQRVSFSLLLSIEDLPIGSEFSQKEWVTLNQARAKVAKTQNNLQK